MNESHTEESRESLDTEHRAEAEGEKAQLFTGSEVNVGDFTRTQGLLKSLRLVLNNQIVLPVEEIASGVSEAGRKFKIGDLEQANLDVARMYSVFRQKVSQWESQARNLEQQTRAQLAKNPKAFSIDTMNRMKAEQTAVRTRIRSTEVQFRRLHHGLDQAFTILQRQTPDAEWTESLPPDFLSRFRAASAADRSAIVKESFEIESTLQVTVSKEAAGYRIHFDPKPPLERFFYLTETGQFIRLRQLNPSVVFDDAESGEKTETRMKEFVKHVQKGVWLLKPRS